MGPAILSLAAAMDEAAHSGIALFGGKVDMTKAELQIRLQDVGTLRPFRPRAELVHDLRPMVPELAPARSLSSRHGTAAFPPHVDGAHQTTPPQFVVMWCAADDEHRPTVLHRWSGITSCLPKAERLRREVFEFRSGRNSIVDTVSSSSRSFVRYDPGCMRPATRGAQALLRAIELAIESQNPLEVRWRPGLGAVVNNWTMLHGRAPAQDVGSRLLYRAWVDRPQERNCAGL